MDVLQIELARMAKGATLHQSIVDVDKILEQLIQARESIANGLSLHLTTVVFTLLNDSRAKHSSNYFDKATKSGQTGLRFGYRGLEKGLLGAKQVWQSFGQGRLVFRMKVSVLTQRHHRTSRRRLSQTNTML